MSKAADQTAALPRSPLARLAALGLGFLLASPLAAQAAAPGIIDVTDYGARCDGVTDDSAALRKAAEAVPATGAELRFPKATCVISRTIFLKSHTRVQGNGSTLLATTPWQKDHPFGYAMLENVHYARSAQPDTGISVNGMIFDYGRFGPEHVQGGGKHSVRFQFARDITVTNNVFQMRGAEDAVAGVGVTNMRVEGNKAYDFRNCAYDFWAGPTNVQVIGNYAETPQSAQMINFNPEYTKTESTGLVAKGFTLTGNTLVGTGPKAVPIQLEPLGPATSVRDLTVSGNTLRNVYLVLRGDVGGAVIRNNNFEHVAGGPPAIDAYPWKGGTGHGIIFANNKIVDPETKPGRVAVLHVEADGFVITGNTITGSHYQAKTVGHGQFNGTEQANSTTP